jgi:hypothetical protein
MGGTIGHRLTAVAGLIAAFAVALELSSGAFAPPSAEAQTDPTVQSVDDPAAGETTSPPVQTLPMATPRPPDIPAGTTTIISPEPGGSTTTSLGGSDVAVASVGGSYEVDGPKRRAKKHAPR